MNMRVSGVIRCYRFKVEVNQSCSTGCGDSKLVQLWLVCALAFEPSRFKAKPFPFVAPLPSPLPLRSAQPVHGLSSPKLAVDLNHTLFRPLQ